MPELAEIKEIDGKIWVRVTINPLHDAGSITLWTPKEVQEYKRNCVRDFLIDLYDQWKDRL